MVISAIPGRPTARPANCMTSGWTRADEFTHKSDVVHSEACCPRSPLNASPDRERLWNENVAIHIDELPGSELMAVHVGTLFVSEDYLTQGSLPTAIMEITEWDA